MRRSSIALSLGLLAGIRWGLDERAGGIPAKWLAALRGRNVVDEILDRAAAR
jgi:hypothetical protein